jgi:hypothetical protein
MDWYWAPWDHPFGIEGLGCGGTTRRSFGVSERWWEVVTIEKRVANTKGGNIVNLEGTQKETRVVMTNYSSNEIGQIQGCPLCKRERQKGRQPTTHQYLTQKKQGFYFLKLWYWIWETFPKNCKI